MRKIILALLCITMYLQVNAQTEVEIGDLWYSLSGETASVANSRYKKSKSSYIIPETVTYKGLTFIVKSIDGFAFSSSIVNQISLPNTLESIGEFAFENCKDLTSITIPASVTTFDIGPFVGCDLLRTIIYLPTKAPKNWTATTYTYVPDKQSYSSPEDQMNEAKIIEMISFKDTSFVYTGLSPVPTWVNNVKGYTASLNMPILNAEVGVHKELIPVTFTKDGESFTANVVYRYTIKPAPLTVKVDNTSREYGEENPTFHISYTGLVGSDDENSMSEKLTVSTTAKKNSDVGEYPIKISGETSTNYDIKYEPGTLTITKAPLTAKVADTTKVYGAKNPTFSLKYSGLKNGEKSPTWTKTPIILTDAELKSPVGSYDVNVTNGIAKNYDVTFVNGNLTITKAPLQVTADNKRKLYCEQNPRLTYSYTGFVNGEDASILTSAPNISTTALANSSVGLYPINISGAEATNYSITYKTGTLDISKRTLNVSTENYNRTYNEENPPFRIIYNGFVNNEDEGVLLSKPTATTIANKSSDVGTYNINLSGGSAENYDFNYTYGTLTIEKAFQTITWNQNLSDVAQYSQIELEAEATSRLPITYTLSNDTVCSINQIGSKTYLDCFHYGKVMIVAEQKGNKNYWQTTRTYKELSVASTTGITPATSGGGQNGKISVSNGQIIVNGLPKGTPLRICSLSGTTIYHGTNCSIKVPAGIYIVRIGNTATKVAVR